MSNEPQNLTAHKNTIEARRAKEQRTDVLKAVKSIMSNDIRAYAFVAIDAEGRAHSTWDTGSIVPLWGFTPMVERILDADITQSDVEDTWKPNLNERTRGGQ